MKKFILSICIAFYFLSISLSPLLSTARAQTPQDAYACILQEDTYFYTAQDEAHGLFLLPKTYFVKVLERGETFCRVEYLSDTQTTKKLCGFVKTDALTFVDFIPYMPYLFHSFEVRYVVDGNPTDSSFLSSITLRCEYYGDYVVGTKTYCYVLRENTFGYVPKPEHFYYPENTEYADYLAAQAPPKNDSTDTQTQTPPTQIAVIIALCLLVPTLTALVLKPPKRPPYETDDFEYGVSP